jgi:TPR repeat protein
MRVVNDANAIKCLSLDDGVAIDADKINKAKNNDGQALRKIGYKYANKLKDYSKAMRWYQLAVNQNETVAYNDIGFMYHNGYGVSRDYITSIEYYLKGASGNEKYSMSNIGNLFLNGYGVSVDTYKALEWFNKSGNRPEKVKALNQQGTHLTEEDKSKPFYGSELCYCLIMIKQIKPSTN